MTTASTLQSLLLQPLRLSAFPFRLYKKGPSPGEPRLQIMPLYAQGFYHYRTSLHLHETKLTAWPARDEELYLQTSEPQATSLEQSNRAVALCPFQTARHPPRLILYCCQRECAENWIALTPAHEVHGMQFLNTTTQLYQLLLTLH